MKIPRWSREAVLSKEPVSNCWQQACRVIVKNAAGSGPEESKRWRCIGREAILRRPGRSHCRLLGTGLQSRGEGGASRGKAILGRIGRIVDHCERLKLWQRLIRSQPIYTPGPCFRKHVYQTRNLNSGLPNSDMQIRWFTVATTENNLLIVRLLSIDNKKIQNRIHQKCVYFQEKNTTARERDHVAENCWPSLSMTLN